MGSTPDSSHVDLPIYHSLSDMAYSSGPSSIVSTRETSPASSTHQLAPTTASPSSFRLKELTPSMDPYNNNTFHAVGDQSAKGTLSNIQQIGRPLSSSDLYDGHDATANGGSSAIMGDWSAQLPSSHNYRCADSSSAIGKISNPTSKEATWNVLHRSIMNHQTESVLSRTPRMDSHNPSGTTHQYPSSPIDNQATGGITSSLVSDRIASVVPGSFSGGSHSRSGSTHQHSSSFIAIDEAPVRITPSIVDERIASVVSGRFSRATPCPSKIANLNTTDQPPTIKSEHPLPPQPLSSPFVPYGLSTSSLASPSTTACSPIGNISAASYSNNNSHIRFATKHLNDSNKLSSPVSPVQLGTSNAFPRQYVSIASPSRQPTTNPASRNDVQQSNNRLLDYKTNDTSNTSSMYPNSGLVIAEGDMNKAMSYCYDRGDGTYTRLVPVDLLPIELADIPARVNTHKGMIVLPIPRKAGPDGQPANSQLAPQTMVTPPSSPIRSGVSSDLVQSRIDRIIGSGPLALTRNYGNPKREKVYCDKWVHDGTCAFTQQGCKFKHEMPADKETQMSLGLFHGPPLWWRKFQAERSMPLDDSPIQLPTSGSSGSGSGSGSGSVSGYYGGSGIVSRYGGLGGLGGPTGAGAGGAFQPGDGSGALGGCWRRGLEAPASGGEGPSTLGSGGASGGRPGPVRGRGSHYRTFVRFGQPQANFGPIGPPSKPATGSGPGLKGKTFAESSSKAGTSARGGAPLNPYEALEDFGGDEEKVSSSAKHSGNTSEDLE